MAKIIKNLDIPTAALDKDELLWVYNGMDTAVTHEVWNNLSEVVKDKAAGAYDFERGMLRPALTMMMRGLKVDEATVDKLRPQLEAARQKLVELFAEYCEAVSFEDPDYRSSVKMKKLFYSHLSIPEKRKNERGVWKVSLDRDTLEKICHEFPRGEPFARVILALRDIDKQLDVLTCKRSKDGRIRTSFNVAGTETWRWSSSESPFWDGTNLQNMNDRLRRIIIADEGMQLFYVDLSQAESRAVAYISGDEAYIKACEGGDLHTTVARMVWPMLPWTGDLKSDVETAEKPFYRHFSYRDMSKRGGHAKNYKITAMSMARRLRIPYRDAVRFELQYLGGEILRQDLERWHAQDPAGGFDLLISGADDILGDMIVVGGAFPKIRDWHDHITAELQSTGQLANTFGFARTFWGRLDDDATNREAVAFNPQSTVGCLLNVGLFRLVNELEPIAPVRCLAQIHDAVLGQIPIGSEKELTPEILKHVVNPMQVTGIDGITRTMVVPADMAFGHNWQKFDADKNPQGMRKFKP